jgi:hypothetical protein
MRSFSDILNESHKTYKFKIGVAGDLPEKFSDKLKLALEKYSVKNLSTGKATPIQKQPLDFPQKQNMEVTYYEAEVYYPTTTQVLHEYLSQMCGVDRGSLVVKNELDPLNTEYEVSKKDENYQPLLTKTELEATSAQQFVGQSRVMDLLKELEKAKQESSKEC